MRSFLLLLLLLLLLFLFFPSSSISVSKSAFPFLPPRSLLPRAMCSSYPLLSFFPPPLFSFHVVQYRCVGVTIVSVAAKKEWGGERLVEYLDVLTVTFPGGQREGEQLGRKKIEFPTFFLAFKTCQSMLVTFLHMTARSYSLH